MLRISFNETLTFDDILLVPRFSTLKSRSEAKVDSCGYSLPISMAPMDLITTTKMIRYFLENNLMANVHRYFKNVEDQYNYIFKSDDLKDLPEELLHKIYFSIGSVQKYKEWINWLICKGITNFLIDMAHGDTQACLDTIIHLRKACPNCSIIAGNICSKSGFERLQNAGANYIRVGVGGGSVCETRIRTGFGVPQLSALIDCASRKSTAKMICCGGIKTTGDIVKAMAVGSDLVFVGKLLAGTDLAGGQFYDKYKKICSEEDAVYREYYGMASKEARKNILSHSSIEGTRGLVKYIGKTSELLNDIKLNLQAALSYNGSKNWDDFKRTVKILKISPASFRESLTHVEEI